MEQRADFIPGIKPKHEGPSRSFPSIPSRHRDHASGMRRKSTDGFHLPSTALTRVRSLTRAREMLEKGREEGKKAKQRTRHLQRASRGYDWRCRLSH